MRLRRHAKNNGVPVAKFDAIHEGVSEENGAEIDEAAFKGLQSFLEVAE